MGGMLSSAAPPKTITLVPGVDAGVLGREWRCTFADGGGGEGGLINSKALEEAQKVLDGKMESLKGIAGVQGINRIVCGGCKDFKVIITANLDEFTAWEEGGYLPEKEFLDELRAIEGISNVDVQKYTIQKEVKEVTVGDSLTLVPGVTADTLAREWRFKFSMSEGDPAAGALINSKSLEEAQKVLNDELSTLSGLQGASTLMRTVCGGCQDFKLTIAMPVKEFKEWEAGEFKPEKELLEKFSKIDGVTAVETQTYTFMSYV